jgi:23S rRNA pseudouridine2605 synthase
VTVTQGRNQQVRRMFEAIGHPVAKLRRVAIGSLTAAGLPLGRYRRLTPKEVARVLRVG